MSILNTAFYSNIALLSDVFDESNSQRQDTYIHTYIHMYMHVHIHMHIFTDVGSSRVSVAIIRVCDSVILFVCLSVRMIKPKRLKIKSPTLAQA